MVELQALGHPRPPAQVQTPCGGAGAGAGHQRLSGRVGVGGRRSGTRVRQTLRIGTRGASRGPNRAKDWALSARRASSGPGAPGACTESICP
jgi:hypothetical protein